MQRTYDNRKVQFNVEHPKALQAGAPNKIRIDARAKPGLPPSRMKLYAQVVDDKGNAELWRTALKDGANDLTLPANLPLKPGNQLSLRVVVVEERGPSVIAGTIAAAGSGLGAAPLATPGLLLAGEADQTLVYEMLPLVTSLYVTHLMTDRPMYRPGETVYFRSLTLERSSLKPADKDFELSFRLVRALGKQEQNVEVLDPDTGAAAQLQGQARRKDKEGKAIVGPDGNPIRGIGAGAFKLPEDLGGGEYTLIVSETQERFPAERRRVLVNRYQAPRLYKDVDFTRKSYGPGDVVTASCKVSPVEGGRVLAGMPVTAAAEVDGMKCEMVTAANLVTDQRGECAVQFKLPAAIERGEGILSVTFTDGGNVETTVETIPIVLKKLKVEFFPEGGELIGGLSNRVYFQVRTPLNKPAELTGRLVDSGGKEVATLHTVNDAKEIGVNQGMGYFEFVPEVGQKYELRVDSPLGIEGKIRLEHPLQQDGVVLHIPQGVVTEKIRVVLTSAKKDRNLLVGAYCRGQLLDHQTVKVEAGKPLPVTLTPANGTGGVYRVTVFEVTGDDDQPLRPLAERLLYRRSPEQLNLKVFTDKKSYTPGDKVTLSLGATTEHQQPVPAIVVVSVVDKSVLKLRNDRTARNLPTHFFLTSEVRGPEDLEYADFLLREEPRDPLGFDIAKAHVALDLLLGTQGWRRFVEQNLPHQHKELLQVYKDDAARFFNVTGQDKVQNVRDPYVAVHADKAVNRFLGKQKELQKDLAVKEAAEEAVATTGQRNLQLLDVGMRAMMQAANKTQTAREEFNKGLLTVGIGVLAVLLLLSAVTLVVLGLVRASQGRSHGLGYLAFGVCLFLAVPVAGFFWLISTNERLDISFTGGPAKQRAGRAEAPMEPQAAKEFDKGPKAPALHNRVQLWDEIGKKDMAERPQLPPGKMGEKNRGDDKEAKDNDGAHPDIAAGNAKAKKPTEGGEKDLKKWDDQADIAGDQRRFPEQPNGRLRALGGDVLGGNRGVDLLVGDRPPMLRRPPLGGDEAMERKLRKEGKFDKLVAERLAKEEAKEGRMLEGEIARALPAMEPFIIREYAHQHKTSADGLRRDFAETLYWHPVLVLPSDKKLDVSFDLSDAVSKFEVQVWGHTLDGRLGAATKEITARVPFSLDAKLPIEISSTDKVAIPVTFTNDTDKNRRVLLKVEADKLKYLDANDQGLDLDANQRVRKVLHFEPAVNLGEARLRLFGKCEPFGSDSVERTFKIVPEGFPIVGKASDLLEKTVTTTIKLPAQRAQWVPGTVKVQAQVFPSTLADLQKGLEALLREPGGCFEQTSSSNYPNVMILDYLRESDQVQPQIEKQARAMLDRGYTQLVAFECIDPQTRQKKQGYEWFGQTAPPHEALTAYGLLEFLDMARYCQVDPAMVERTKKYLLGQRDGKGGFLRNPRALDSFGGAPQHIADAYIVWALCEADVKEDITLEIQTAVTRAEKSQDPYLAALASLSLLKRGQGDRAVALLKMLRTKQKDDGSVPGAETSITRSGGSQLLIETTSLAILAWLRANQPAEFDANVRKGVEWIGKQRGGYGGYGSTQSTILALKALIAHTRANRKTAEAGEVRLFVNDRGEPVAVKAFAAGTRETISVELPDEQLLQPGDNTIRVEITGKNVFPHTVTWSYMALTPANKDVCLVRLATNLSAVKATEGETVRMTARLENASGQGQGMAVAILGLPAGLAPPTDLQELRNLVKAGKIDAFEVHGRELVLYWRELTAKAKQEVNVNLICQIPGEYRGPASRAYLYYNADERWWTEPVGIAITPK